MFESKRLAGEGVRKAHKSFKMNLNILQKISRSHVLIIQLSCSFGWFLSGVNSVMIFGNQYQGIKLVLVDDLAEVIAIEESLGDDIV